LEKDKLHKIGDRFQIKFQFLTFAFTGTKGELSSAVLTNEIASYKKASNY